MKLEEVMLNTEHNVDAQRGSARNTEPQTCLNCKWLWEAYPQHCIYEPPLPKSIQNQEKVRLNINFERVAIKPSNPFTDCPCWDAR